MVLVDLALVVKGAVVAAGTAVLDELAAVTEIERDAAVRIAGKLARAGRSRSS